MSHLPLTVLHALGALLGLGAFAVSGVYRTRLRQNAAQAGYGLGVQFRAAMHAGMMVAELPRIWMGKPVSVTWRDKPSFDALMQSCQASKRGIIVLAPHIGCWEMVGQRIAHEAFKDGAGTRMTVMYKPAKQAWLDEIIRTSREQPAMQTVPADLSGVRALLRVLKNGQVIGVLPDQVPPKGMGAWVDLFGKPAYTMTMAAKMAQVKNERGEGAQAIVCWCERQFGGAFVMNTRALDLEVSAPLDQVVLQINQGVQDCIRALPHQYLWGYARYKVPKELSA